MTLHQLKILLTLDERGAMDLSYNTTTFQELHAKGLINITGTRVHMLEKGKQAILEIQEIIRRL